MVEYKTPKKPKSKLNKIVNITKKGFIELCIMKNEILLATIESSKTIQFTGTISNAIEYIFNWVIVNNIQYIILLRNFHHESKYIETELIKKCEQQNTYVPIFKYIQFNNNMNDMNDDESFVALLLNKKY